MGSFLLAQGAENLSNKREQAIIYLQKGVEGSTRGVNTEKGADLSPMRLGRSVSDHNGAAEEWCSCETSNRGLARGIGA